MKKTLLFLLTLLCTLSITAQKPRVLISTDIGGTDPDDNQSMVHLMMYSDLFQLEGLVSSPSFGNGSKEEILRMIDLYAQDYPKLKRHNAQLMSPKAPAKLTYTIHSDIKKLDGLKGCFVVDDVWPGKPHEDDYQLGAQWYSDCPDRTLYEGKWQGAKTQRKWRKDILEDWANRWSWLKK